MAAITVQPPPTRTGLDFSAVEVAAAGGGDYFVVINGSEYLVAHNGDASNHDVQLVFQQGEDGVVPANKTYTVIAGHVAILGPFPACYVDGNSQVHWTYSAATSMKVSVFRTT